MALQLQEPLAADVQTTKSPTLAAIGHAVTRYNALAPSSPPGRRTAVLMAIVRCIGHYVTHKPMRQGKSVRRWMAVGELIEQVFAEARRHGIALLASTSDPSGFGQWGDRSYWLELIDEKHRPGHKLSKSFSSWNCDRAAARDKVSFWTWLDGDNGPSGGIDSPYVVGPSGPAPVTIADAPQESWIVGEPPAPPAWLTSEKEGVTYLDATSGEAHRYEIRFLPNGLLMEAHSWMDDSFDTQAHFSVDHGKGWAIFVASPTGRLYAGSHVEGKFHHSSFLAGRPVLAAGELLVDRGRLLAITCQSGHYQPTPQAMQDFVKRFAEIPAGVLIQPRHDPKEFVHVGEFRRKGMAATPMDIATVRRLMPAWADKSRL